MIRRRKALLWFGKKMEEALRWNDYKGGWENCSNEYLIAKLNEEVDELKQAIWMGKSGDMIMQEAADVANIAMMLADNNKPDGERIK